MGCLPLNSWEITRNAPVYLWHKSFLGWLLVELIQAPPLPVSFAIFLWTQTFSAFASGSRSHLSWDLKLPSVGISSLRRSILLPAYIEFYSGKSLRAGGNLTSTSQEWFRWENPSWGVVGPHGCHLCRRRCCSPICHLSPIDYQGGFEWSDLSLFFLISQSFSLSSSLAEIFFTVANTTMRASGHQPSRLTPDWRVICQCLYPNLVWVIIFKGPL